MSFAATAAWIGVGLTAGKMLHGAASAIGDEGADDMMAGAQDVYANQERIAGSTQSLSYEKADLAIQRAGNVRDTGSKTVGFGARKSMTNLVQAGKTTSSKQGFANDRSTRARQESSAAQVQGQYQNQMKTLADSYSFSKQSGDIAKGAADITYEKDIASAQKELNYALAEADAADRGIFEGMFS
jgi:hypothetical protein